MQNFFIFREKQQPQESSLRPGGDFSETAGFFKNQTMPWLIMALAIFSKPAMLAPATRLPFMP